MGTRYDGQYYEQGQPRHDLGSFVCYNVKQEETTDTLYIRDYMGKSVDIPKLPTYESLATGSSAFCIDTGDVLFYDSKTKSWNPL